MEQVLQELESLDISNNSDNDNNSNNSDNDNNSNNNINIKSKMEQQRSFLIQNLKLVHPFNGQKEKLSIYISSIESILPNIAIMPHDDRILFFNCILRTLDGEALNLVRREQPENWASLKQLLISEFGEHQPIPNLILSINNIKFRGNVKKLCNDINNLVCRISDAIKLCNETADRKVFFKSEANLCSLRVLKRELPNHLVALLNANLARDFKTAVQILRENNEIEENNIQSNFKSNTFQNNPRTNIRPQVMSNEYRNIATANIRFPYQQNTNDYFQNPNRNQNFNNFHSIQYNGHRFSNYPHDNNQNNNRNPNNNYNNNGDF